MENSENIMVVRRDVLIREHYFDGFMDAREFDFESVILANFEWMARDEAEKDIRFKQPIGYQIMYKPSTREVFLYLRNKKNTEQRLQGKWSCGVGGHIEQCDVAGGSNPIHESSLREMDEEVAITGGRDIRVLGYINDDTDAVGRVHFGILYLVTIDDDATITVLDPHIAEGSLVSLDDLEEKCNSQDSVENWTKIACAALRNL